MASVCGRHRRITPYGIACILVAIVMVGYIVKGFRQTELNGNLIRAIADNRTDIAITLLQDGADANAEDHSEHGYGFGKLLDWYKRIRNHNRASDPTALMLVYSPDRAQWNLDNEPTKLVHELLARGAKVNATASSNFWSASPVIIHASAIGNTQCVKEMLDFGADPNARNSVGGTPIMHAGNLPTIQLLIARGANVNARNNEGYSVLGLAEMFPDSAVRTPVLKAAGARH